MFKAATDMFRALEGPLKLVINQDNTTAVGSLRAPVVSLCRLLAIGDAAVAPSVRNLGVGFAPP